MKGDMPLTDKETARRTIPLLDLTSLGDEDGNAGIDSLCRRAELAGVSAVCVWPRFVRRCRNQLNGSGISVATVVNFPHGGDDARQTAKETRIAIESGANEIDLVMPYLSWLSGNRASGRKMISQTKAICGENVLLKVILETGKLGPRTLIQAACQDAILAGADFLKTSTGKIRVSATPTAARIMLETIRTAQRPVGLKVAGGVRTVRQAANYLRLADKIMGSEWVGPHTFRFGSSRLLDACERITGQ